MSQVHISERDAVRDFAAVLAKLDAGEVVTIDREGDGQPVYLLPHRAFPPAVSSVAEATDAPEEKLQYLSEFRELHPEPLDRSPWE